MRKVVDYYCRFYLLELGDVDAEETSQYEEDPALQRNDISYAFKITIFELI